jgi:hypothetical protein
MANHFLNPGDGRQDVVPGEKDNELMKRKGSLMKSSRRIDFAGILLLIALTGVSGCGGSKTAQVGLPGAPPAGEVNSYVGQPGDTSSSNSLWGVTINRTQNTYSYGPTSGGTAATSGSMAVLNNNFIILLGPNGYQSGLAVEVPGQAVILRPGDNTTPLIFAVQQSSCFAIGGNVKFLYALSPGINGLSSPFFGEIYAATSSDGSDWQFNNQQNFLSPFQFEVNEGTNVPPDSEIPGYPAGYSATCTTSQGAANVSATPLAYFNQGADTFSVPTQFAISPGGLFFEDQNYSSVPSSENWPYPNIASWGVSEPAMPLSTGGVATASYAGFLFEADFNASIYRTRLVGFGNAPVSGTVMNGGTFPNEDPTQTPDVNMSVTFNSQDPLNNGLYYLATLTIPNDASSTFTANCVSYGISPTGSSTCTNDGVAMVGQQNGLYTIIMSASNAAGGQLTLVLFQQ